MFHLKLPCSTSLAGLGLTCLGLIATPITASAQLDHFRCFDAVYPLSPPPEPLGSPWALLQDRFDEQSNQIDIAFVLPPERFCNPTAKLRLDNDEFTPRENPNSHLTFYPIVSFRPGAPQPTVEVENQFGVQALTIQSRAATYLAVPTEKDPGGPFERLDHFKCYPVDGEPVNIDVRLFDEFSPWPIGKTTRIFQPELLCNPTLKFHPEPNPPFLPFAPIENERANLTCYETGQVQGTRKGITIRNQFENTNLVVEDTLSLCVPNGEADPVASLGDYVWNDLNVNGLQDDGETGIDGVTVQLLSCAGDELLTTVTGAGGPNDQSADPNGFYEFTGLAPGCYKVKFETPPGFAPSPRQAGGNPALDSDGGTSDAVTLAGGAHDATLDAGFYRPPEPKDGPDLIPDPGPPGKPFCRIDPSSGGLLVEVTNIGDEAAGPSKVQVDFFENGVKRNGSIKALAPGSSDSITVPLPAGCSPLCDFRVWADFQDDVAESDEGNNVRRAFCP